MVQVTFPGVYVEEVPSGVRTITGVSTSVAAFIGFTPRGPINKPVKIFNFSDYQRNFGGLSPVSDLGHTIQHFFLNGGQEAWVVRVASGASKAGISLRNLVAAGTQVLTLAAVNEGDWGNYLRVTVDYKTVNPDSLFNLTVEEYEESEGQLTLAKSETHRNLSMDSHSTTYAVDTINSDSSLITAESLPADITPLLAAEKGTSISGDLSALDFSKLDDDHRRLAVTVNGDGPHEFDLFDAGGGIPGADQPAKLTNLAQIIQLKIRAITGSPAFSNFVCVKNDSGVTATSGEAGERSAVHFTKASIRDAGVLLKLGLANGGREADAVAIVRPAPTGTISKDLTALDFTTLTSDPAKIKVAITNEIGTSEDISLQLWVLAERPTTLDELVEKLTAALHSAERGELKTATVSLVDNRLSIIAGGSNPNPQLDFKNQNGGDGTADSIGLVTGVSVNITRYALGKGVTARAQSTPLLGFDGQPPTVNEYLGDRDGRKGIFALEEADIFNIMCIPEQFPTDAESALLAQALEYCEERRALLIVDLPTTAAAPQDVQKWYNSNSSLLQKNGAVYFPQINVPDQLQNFRVRAFASSGAIAGIWARTDSERGVWKAPAGTEASIRGVRGLAYPLTDQENGELNQLGINCLRTFPVFGKIVWGARTLVGADQMADQWKYIPVRRTALFIEESLYRATKWVVFEPNDEPLWSQIRLNVGAFMHGLFRQGAFQGKTPAEAYFVKCDKETTTQDDINHGVVNILVGFAPLKPAEFVIIRIQQLAGQIQT